MTYVNVPPNLRDLFQGLSDRINKLELAPNGPQDTADTASVQATQAYAQSLIAGNQATQAALQAGVAQTTADGKNTVHYSTSTPGSTANKVGDIWYQYGTGTYSNQVIAQWSGAGGTSWTSVQVSGLVIANIDAGTIKTGTLTSIAIYAGSSGQFQVSAAGALSATNASIQGAINATSGSIGGFTISSADYLSYGSTYIYGNSSYSSYCISDASRGININAVTVVSSGSSSIQTSGGIYASGGLVILGNGQVAGTFANTGYVTYTGAANMRISTTSGIIGYTSSSERYKVAIEEQTIPIESILALNPKSYVDKTESEEKGTTEGLQRWLGLIAEDVAQIPVLKDLLTEYNKDGQPQSVYYDRIAVALIPLLKDHEARLNKLEGK
jgi:Chaperone of endosialidase